MTIVVSLLLISGLFSQGVALYFNISISRQLYQDLLYEYDKDVRPPEPPFNTTNVQLFLYLQAVQDLDEVRQTFTFSAAFALSWNDTGMVWNPEEYGGIWHVEISYDRVWTPDFVLTTPSKEAMTFGQSWQKVSFDYEGEAVWFVIGLVESTCQVNNRKYPFDTHECKAEFIIWGYTIYEIEFTPYADEVDLSFYRPSGSWDLVKSSITTSSINYLEWPQMEVTLYLRRKPWFVMTNVLGPVFILNMLNIMVFFLVPESGERVSYCLTVLLAISVFLTIVNDNLPKNSEPMPLISYKLMVDLANSALITVAVIFNLKLYHREEDKEIPHWAKSLYKVLTSKSQKCNKVAVRDRNTSINSIGSVSSLRRSSFVFSPEHDKTLDLPPEVETANGMKDNWINDDVKSVAWVKISNMMDYVFLVIFSTAFFSSSFIYIILVTT